MLKILDCISNIYNNIINDQVLFSIAIYCFRQKNREISGLHKTGFCLLNTGISVFNTGIENPSCVIRH